MKKILYLIAIFGFVNMILSSCKNNKNKQDTEYCKIKLDLNGGEFNQSTEYNVEVGKQVPVPETPIKEGYTFVGWYLGEEKWSFKSDCATINLTLKAHWTINQYKLSIDYDDESRQNEELLLNYGDSINLIDPTKTGYTFINWSEVVPQSMPANDISIKAQWKINQYKIVIKFNDGVTEDKIIEQDYDTEIEEIVIPKKLGYSFAGWSETIPNKIPAKNMEINGKFEPDVKYVIKNNEIEIKGLAYDVIELYILNEYDGFKVTSISGEAFANNYSLKIVHIADSVIEIGDRAFYDSSIESISLSNNIVSLGNFVFCNCRLLKSVELPEKLENIGNFAFYYCRSLKNIVLPNNLKTIGENAFSECVFESIVLPGELETIGEKAFYACSQLSEVVIPNNIKSIGKSAFEHCYGLKYVSLPFVGPTKEITNESYFGYLFGAINCTVSLSEYSNLEEVKITGESEIASGAFCGTNSIKKLVISEKIKSIGAQAFYGCIYLESITLPFIGNKFDDEKNIHFGYIFSMKPIFSEWAYYRYIPSTLKEVIITRSSSIKSEAFLNCSYIESIKIKGSINKIESKAFSGCTSLTKIVIDGKVQSIEDYAFESSCDNLIIYCCFDSSEVSWNSKWNYKTTATYYNVVWNYTDE